jgi:phosphatidate cytidylyltransferase
MTESLRKRIITAVILAVLFLGVLLWLPPLATVIVVTALVLVGAWEWSAFLRPTVSIARVAYVALLALLLLGVRYVAADPEGRHFILITALVWWLVALGWIIFAPRSVARWSAGLAGVLALVPAWVALVWFRYLPNGQYWVLFTLLLVWGADIGAYFAGHRFGRTRLAPDVSPGKTWEGVVGGFALSAIVAVAGSAWFALPLYAFVPLCLAAVGFSIVGDLTESLLKRFAGVKDSGTLFPGHGGVMDRIDSVTGAAPVLFFGLTMLGVVA